MDNFYEKRFYLRLADFDVTRHLKPASILDLFQCVASEHAEALGIGFEAMLAKEILWVLVRVRYEVLSPVGYGTESLTVRTWPLAPGRSTFQREYRVTDENGNTVIKGSSDWVLMHSVRRRLMPVRDLYPIKDGFCEEKMFEERSTPIPEIHAEGEGVTILPGYADLDINGHVGNTKYADLILSAYPPKAGAHLRALRMDFHREVLAGAPITLYRKEQEKTYTVCGRGADGERMFTAELTYFS